jgi:hypothetical protein
VNANQHGATLQSDPHIAIHVALRVKDLTTQPDKFETFSYCHLQMRDLQQAQPKADLVLHHIAVVALTLSTLHTPRCSLLLIY